MSRLRDPQERPDKKKRLSVYLDPGLMRLLADFADRREQSRSIVAEAAIASFLSPDADERQEAAIARRLDRIDRNIQRLERDIGIANEAFAIFIRNWLTSTASLTEVGQAVHAKAASIMIDSRKRLASASPGGRDSGRKRRTRLPGLEFRQIRRAPLSGGSMPKFEARPHAFF